VRGIPFAVLYRDGQPAAEAIGAQPKPALERALGLGAAVAAAAQSQLRQPSFSWRYGSRRARSCIRPR
jgi:thioredoxin-like negative regulator of GroEL